MLGWLLGLWGCPWCHLVVVSPVIIAMVRYVRPIVIRVILFCCCVMLLGWLGLFGVGFPCCLEGY